MSPEPEIVIERQANGCWKAMLRIGEDETFAAGNFRTRREARDWAKAQIDFLSEDPGKASDG